MMSLTLLTDHFADIEDPRQASKVTYKLFDVLFLTLTAVISGAEGWEEIEDFGHLRLKWLKKYGDFSHGIPVHDTIARLVCRIDPQTFHQRFIQWMQATEKLTDKQVVAVDGKTLRRSYKRYDRQSTLHMISAFATKNGVVLGQRRTDEKSNEINAVPELLELLELEGAMVTLDAMSCQKQIVKTIVKKKADYYLEKHRKRSMVALDNLVDLIVTCVSHKDAGNQTFMVSDDADVSTPELLSAMTRAYGKSPRLLSCPPSALSLGASVLGKRAVAERLLGSLQVDIEHTKQVLGWTPCVKLDDVLKEMVRDSVV